MSVRAKLSSYGPNIGSRGVELSFYAVYEGNAELQQITENAIFGNATPNASLTLVGDIVPKDMKSDEEYFVDLTDHSVPHGWMILGTYEERFRSAFNPNYPEGPTRFRYDIRSEGSWRGSFDLSVLNPDAIEWMDRHKTGIFAVRLARGRRSDREIAIREAQVEEMREQFARNDRLTPEEREFYLSSYVRKLAIAKGEI